MFSYDGLRIITASMDGTARVCYLCRSEGMAFLVIPFEPTPNDLVPVFALNCFGLRGKPNGHQSLFILSHKFALKKETGHPPTPHNDEGPKGSSLAL